jgi:excisionase family DNA binding protein
MNICTVLAGINDGTKQMLKISQVATRLNVVPQTVLGWIAKGVQTPNGLRKLSAVRAGRSWRVSEQSLEEFLDSNESDDPPPKKKKRPSDQKIIDAELKALKEFLDKNK